LLVPDRKGAKGGGGFEVQRVAGVALLGVAQTIEGDSGAEEVDNGPIAIAQGAPIAPGKDDGVSPMSQTQEMGIVIGPDGIGGGFELCGVHCPEGKEIHHLDRPKAPGLGKPQATPNRWVIGCGIGPTGIEHDKPQPGQPPIPLAPEAVAIGCGGIELCARKDGHGRFPLATRRGHGRDIPHGHIHCPLRETPDDRRRLLVGPSPVAG